MDCFTYVSTKLLDVQYLQDFSHVEALQSEFCEDGNACAALLKTLPTMVTEWVAEYPDCADKITDTIKGSLNVEGDVDLADIFAQLEKAKTEICAIDCKTDGACWTCAGAGMLGTVVPASGFCDKVPFCAAADDKCAVDASFTCDNRPTVKTLFKGKLTAVIAGCTDVETSCSDACKTAFVDFLAFAKSVKDDPELVKSAMVCMMEVAGEFPAIDFGALLPRFVGEDSDLMATFMDKCTIDDAQVSLKLESSKAEIAVALSADAGSDGADGAADGSESGSSSLAPATAIAVTGAGLLTLL